MSTIEILKALTLPLFADVPDADLAIIARAMHLRKLEPRQLVFARGDTADEILIVVSGRLRISIATAEGRELSFRAAGRGDVIGEIAVLDGGVRTADVTAIDRSEVLALGKAALNDLIARSPALARAIIATLCQRLRETSDQLESIALHRIESRLARFFLTLARERPAKPDGRVEFSFTLSQGELALLLGASRPKINLALTWLEEQGAIARKGQRLSCRIDSLSTIAGTEAE